jgi:hypothetical protein
VNKLETERLVRKVAVLDNRNVNEAVIDAWYEVVSHIDYTVAERALIKARQDANVQWLEPKHLVAKAREAIIELNDEARQIARDAEDEGRADPEPVCRNHRRRITTCAECCRVLAVDAGHLSGQRLHDWAVANLYVSESA